MATSSVKKYYVGLLGGIENTPSAAFHVYLDEDNIVLDCLKLKLLGSHKVLSTYKVPLDRVITAEVVNNKNITDKEVENQLLTGLQTPLFSKTHDIIDTLVAADTFLRPGTPPSVVVLSIVYFTPTNEINNLTFAIGTYCGVDDAVAFARIVRVKLSLEKEIADTVYEQNEKGEYLL